MDLDLTRPQYKFTLVPDGLQRSVGRVFFFVPYHTKVYFCARIFDLECYATEMTWFIPTSIVVSGYTVAYVCGVFKALGLQAPPPSELFKQLMVGEQEWMDGNMPRILGWFRRAVRKGQEVSVRVREVKEGLKLEPLLKPTPEEAIEKDGLQRFPRHSRGITPGEVRVHYYHNFDIRKHGPDPNSIASPKFLPPPDAWLDVPVDEQTGVDIDYVRKRFGLESLAIITDMRRIDNVFYPVDQDRLSPIAAYNLSKQWTVPIKVFEPTTSLTTPLARTIRSYIYPSVYFFLTLCKLFLGIPEENTQYLFVLYGRSYASFYQQAGILAKAVKSGLFTLLMFLIALPLCVAYYTFLGGKAAVRRSIAAIGRLFSAIVALFSAALCALSNAMQSVRSANWSTWFALGVFAITLAEYQA